MSIKVFVSSAPGNLGVRKNQYMLSTILTAKKIDYEQIDLTDPKNSELKQALIDELKEKSLAFIPPIIYCGDEYLGNFDDFFESVELESVESFLRVPGATNKSFDDFVSTNQGGLTECAAKSDEVDEKKGKSEEESSSSAGESDSEAESGVESTTTNKAKTLDEEGSGAKKEVTEGIVEAKTEKAVESSANKEQKGEEQQSSNDAETSGMANAEKNAKSESSSAEEQSSSTEESSEEEESGKATPVKEKKVPSSGSNSSSESVGDGGVEAKTETTVSKTTADTKLKEESSSSESESESESESSEEENKVRKMTPESKTKESADGGVKTAEKTSKASEGSSEEESTSSEEESE